PPVSCLHGRAIRRLTVRVTLPQPLAPLHDLMLNLRWSWHLPTVELFESIDTAGWAACSRDPLAMLSSMGPGRQRQAAPQPPEGGQRPRCAAHRGRAALPARVFQPVAVSRRLAGGALPG